MKLFVFFFSSVENIFNIENFENFIWIKVSFFIFEICLWFLFKRIINIYYLMFNLRDYIMFYIKLYLFCCFVWYKIYINDNIIICLYIFFVMVDVMFWECLNLFKFV